MKPNTVAEMTNVVQKVDIKKDYNFCFVIMSYSGNPVIESYYEEGIKKSVEKYGMECVRVDKEVFDGKITDRIRHNIENSCLVIVDTTEDRPNCYFEAGYAVAKSKDIIWMRLNAPTLVKTSLEFDVKDYPHILYTTIQNLRENLQARIEFYLQDA